MQAYRAAILRFADDQTPIYDPDGLLVVGPDAKGQRVVRAVGGYSTLVDRFPGVAIEDLRGHIVAPGFVDLHIHYPQTDVIGAPAAGLLPWLENYTFPHESRFSDAPYASGVAGFFLDELQRNGVTTALAFATSHPSSVNALFEAAQARGLRLITGKVLQDRHSPDGVRDDTEQSLIDTETLIQRWHGVDRLGYAITPRIDANAAASWPRSECGFDEWHFFQTVPAELDLKPFCNWLKASLNDWPQYVGVGFDLRRQLEAAKPEVPTEAPAPPSIATEATAATEPPPAVETPSVPTAPAQTARRGWSRRWRSAPPGRGRERRRRCGSRREAPVPLRSSL